MSVSLGTAAQATAVTSLAPCLAIPPASASFPTMNPVKIKTLIGQIIEKNVSAVLFIRHQMTA